ncbi:GEVED domain-containing protein [Portibacter lacus]|uniref:HYR domain-containing protein n=1 Tax=Portibacter lacus TaxID=1099794 RepID=A0AA37SL47_9BACT|nr:GEVED domain-containing protein [Portibacter lacus]GLR15917.1 hypothetical protein GCM10007940_05320 [Portibacter lacus]
MKKIQPLITLRSSFSYLILCILFTTPHFLSGQNVTLSNQTQVDTFSQTEVIGNLIITGADITNLDSLSALSSVTGYFTISNNPELLNLEGLSSLASIGRLHISYNESLLSLEGLSSLTSLEQMSIISNESLFNIDAFSAISSLYYLRVTGNPKLPNLNALSSLDSVTAELIINGNNLLSNLEGLSALRYVGGRVEIINNETMSNLQGLTTLNTVGGLLIRNNPILQSLNGLNNLSCVGGVSNFYKTGGIEISRNPSLKYIEGLSALSYIEKDLVIDDNDGLINLNIPLSLDSLNQLIIKNNDVLLNLNISPNLDSLSKLEINNNDAMLNLNGLSKISYVGSLNVHDNDALINFKGLSSLLSANIISISSNASLLSLEGLEGLTSVSRLITVTNNPVLQNLAGLSSLTSVTQSISISDNDSLTSYCGLFPLLNGGSYTSATISGNAVNPTITEIIENGACISITCPSDNTAFTDIGICCAAITLLPPTLQGGSSTTTLVNDYNNTSDASDTYFVMTTIVNWTATDAYGNQSSCSQNITVIDNEGPQFGVPDPSCSMYQSCYDTQTIALSNNETTYQQALATCNGDAACIQAATKAKSKELEQIRKNFQSCLNGNTNCSLLPISGALPDLIVFGEGANCEAQVDNPGPVVAENCAAFILTNDNATATNALGSGIYSEGTTTVTWTATDQFGNVSIISIDIIVTTENCGNPYCESMGNSTEYEWIDMISINGISNQSGNDAGYADFTQIILPIVTGNNSIQLTPGFSNENYREYWTIYIDFNQDSDFDDPGEIVYYKKSRFQIQSTFNVPMTALEGTTGMRISMSYNGWQSPCTFFNEGEVEDYTVNISFCDNLSDGGLIGEDQILCDGANDPSEILNIVSPSGGTGNVEYLWLKNITTSEPPTAQNMNGWVEISNSNVASFDPETISTTTWYMRCARNEGCIEYSAESNVVKVAFSEECSIDYCESEGASTDYEWIKKVKFATINNNSGNNGGYADFTNQTAEVNAGHWYALMLKPGFAGNSFKEYWRVWIDWNQDGDFEDPDELVIQTKSYGSSTFTRWINVPSDAINGNTGMRVSMKYGSYASSCESFNDGEIEDYTVHVSEGQSLSGNPPIDETNADTRSENLDDIAELDVNVYPNPTTDIFSIDISSNIEGERNVQIINQIGQIVYNLDSVENSIRIDPKGNNITSGLYYIVIRENDRVITKQLYVIQ